MKSNIIKFEQYSDKHRHLMSSHQGLTDLQIHRLGIGSELKTLAQVQHYLMETWLHRKEIVRFQTHLIVRNRI